MARRPRNVPAHPYLLLPRLVVTPGGSIAAVCSKHQLPPDWQFATHTCVVGASDSEWGEVVIAFVVHEPGSSVTIAELDAHCLDLIARFKRPKRYNFMQALPKNSYGKVLKRELRNLLAPSAKE
jgi:acyl-CoA synthetase (AMP-forming)/AMP-acid ligase II